MLSLLDSVLEIIGSDQGEGVMSLLSWLISGLMSIFSEIRSVAVGIFDLLDALLCFFVSVKDATLGLLPSLFPWIPADVMNVISLGLFAVLLAGFVKKVSDK